MFSRKLIIEKIKRCVDSDNSRFVIFPYGENGQNVKKILLDYFDLEPLFIVDDEFFKYNKKIINYEEFVKKYDENMIVILTAEDEALNTELYITLKEFVVEEKIINLKRESQINIAGDGRFEIKKFLPLKKNKKERMESENKGIKVRVFHDSVGTWNAMVSICKAFQEDNECDLGIILNKHKVNGTDYKKMKIQIRSIGCLCFEEEEYDVTMDKPDILILIHPRADYREVALKYRENVRMIVVAAMTLIRYDSRTEEEFKRFVEKGYGCFHPDYWLFDSLMYHELYNKNVFDGKIIEMGNAKFDGIYEACKKKYMPSQWKKIENKKRIFWSPDHGIYNGEVLHTITFDLYAKSIFKYAELNTNVGFIFRPHPTFVNEMLENGYWSSNDLELLKAYIASTDNMVWDDFDTYDISYALADAILIDGHCGMICSALPLQKPIGVMYREKGDDWLHPELTENYYKIFCENDLLSFFGKIVLNEEDDKQNRKSLTKKYIRHFDGKNGKRIKDLIKKEFIKKYKN